MKPPQNLRFESLCIHAGLESSDGSQAIVPPISPGTIYEVHPEGRREGDYHYARLDNPNRRQWEALICALEGGAAAAAFSSGIAAASAVLQSLDPGDHVLFPFDVYSGNRKLITQILQRWGLRYDFIRMDGPGAISGSINENTRMVWIETPSNPQMHITDIRAVCGLASSRGILTCVDNTWPTPFNQLPLALGADLVIHSTTKYFGGHSDVMGGAVITKQTGALWDRIKTQQQIGGAVPSPFDCWMLSRSTRTLAYRMRGHNRHADIVAEFLTRNPVVTKVYHPGLENHPGHQTAKSQMSGFGGMVSFLVDGSARDAVRVVSKSRLIRRATSLGGVESTWEHRLGSEGEGSPTPENLIRISVGLEHPDDLLEDLEQALKR